MKKNMNFVTLFAIVVAIISAFVLTGCGQHADAISDSQQVFGVDKEETETVKTEKEVVPSYFEDGLFYYRQLSDEEQVIYNQMLVAGQNFETTVEFSQPLPIETIRKVHHAVTYDYPEFEWMGSYSIGVKTNDRANGIRVTFKPAEDSKERYQAILAEADEIVAQTVNLSSDYEKMLFFHDYLVSNLTYGGELSEKQSIYSALVEKETVCAGYAKAFHFLCKRAGLDCTLVFGLGEGVNHAWNLVYIDGNHYWVDVTFDDPLVNGKNDGECQRWNYFLVSDEVMEEDHVLNDGILTKTYSVTGVFQFPRCDSSK